MQEELIAIGPQIEQKARETEELLAQLGQDQDAVEEVKAIVQQEEEVSQAQIANRESGSHFLHRFSAMYCSDANTCAHAQLKEHGLHHFSSFSRLRAHAFVD